MKLTTCRLSASFRHNIIAGMLLILAAGCMPQKEAEVVKSTPTPLDPYRMVRAHNIWRTDAGLPGLHWSNELAAKAKSWAEKLALQGCSLKHSDSVYGENIFWAGPREVTTQNKKGETLRRHQLQDIKEQEVVDSWAEERQWYSHKDNSCNAPDGRSCGHYTQIVWKDTLEVGCAKAVCSDNSQVWVCFYDPPGNFSGQSPY